MDEESKELPEEISWELIGAAEEAGLSSLQDVYEKFAKDYPAFESDIRELLDAYTIEKLSEGQPAEEMGPEEMEKLTKIGLAALDAAFSLNRIRESIRKKNKKGDTPSPS